MTTTEERPGDTESTGADDQRAAGPSSTLPEVADTIAQLRRRRAAACRMPPVGDSPADPLDTLAAVPRSLPSTIAAHRARQHLADHRLLDGDGWLDGVLAEGVVA